MSWITYTKTESDTIRDAFRAFWFMIDHTRITHDIEAAVKSAKSMGSDVTIRHREVVVMKAFLQGFKTPRGFTAADLHGMSEWWQTSIMAGAAFRVQHHDQDSRLVAESLFGDSGPTERVLTRGAKARRAMRAAVAAHEAAWDRHFGKGPLAAGRARS